MRHRRSAAHLDAMPPTSTPQPAVKSNETLGEWADRVAAAFPTFGPRVADRLVVLLLPADGGVDKPPAAADVA